MTLAISPLFTPASGTRSAPLTVSFEAQATGDYPPFTYQWNFGDGYTAELDAGTHDYVIGGTYPVSLVVTDSLGYTETWSTSYEINPALFAAFTAVTTIGPGGANSTSFTVGSLLGSAPYTYAWTFGDGGTSAAANPTHVYSAPGAYDAKLIVTDADGHVSSATRRVEISTALSITIVATPILGTDPTVVDFIATASAGTAPYTYAWDFGDGLTATGAIVQHTYGKTGTFAVQVRATDTLGHSSSTSIDLVVAQNLTASPLRIPEKGPAPLAVTFYARPTGGSKPYRFEWNFVDGTTSTLENPVHEFLGGGYYNVSLVVTDSAGQAFSTSLAVDVSGAVQTPVLVPAISSALAVNAVVGEAFSYRITATNYPTSFDSTPLPDGLTLNAISGVISGVPTLGLPNQVTISATNASGTGSDTLHLTFVPQIDSSLAIAAVIGDPFSYQITALNEPTSFDASQLPEGLSVNPATGAITGTPTGLVHATIGASNGAGRDQATLDITLSGSGGGGGDFLNGQEINLQQGLDDSFTVATTGSPLSFAFGTLPDGLTQVGVSGTITGLPIVFGDYTVSVDVTYSDHVSSGAMILHIAEAFAPVFTFPLDELIWPEGVYQNFPLTVEANPLPLSWNITNHPNGMWDYQYPVGDHILYGTPYGAASYQVSISATNWAGTITVELPVTIFVSSFQVSNTSTQFDDIYAPSEEAFYALNYYLGVDPPPLELVYGSSVVGPVRVYRASMNSNLALFYFETYQSWVLADVSTFDGGPPFACFPGTNNGAPPETSWQNSPYGQATITRV